MIATIAGTANETAQRIVTMDWMMGNMDVTAIAFQGL